MTWVAAFVAWWTAIYLFPRDSDSFIGKRLTKTERLVVTMECCDTLIALGDEMGWGKDDSRTYL